MSLFGSWWRWLWWRRLFRRPGTIYVWLEKLMAGKLRVRVSFPPVGAVDVVTREFTRTVNSEPPVVESLPFHVPSFEFLVDDGAVCQLSLVDIDDAGNRSPASTRTFTAVDTIPPSQPGDLVVDVIGEEP